MSGARADCGRLVVPGTTEPRTDPSTVSAPITFEHFKLLPASRQLLVDGRQVAIGARAFDVLSALIERRERLVTKAELLDLVWPDVVVEENNLQVQISALRKLLGPQAIATIPGRGYQFTAVPDGAASDKAPPASPRPADTRGAALTNLPTEMPPLYGRVEELEALRALVETNRLVTVVGAGGIGKTALAEALADRLRGSLEDGAWFVELAPVTDAALVVTTVANVLQVTLGAHDPVGKLASALEAKRMILVLDNCEHLLDVVAELATALHRQAPNVRVLATSQEPLKVGGESVYRLGSLTLPTKAGIESARQAGAIALFEARARASQPQFALDERNVEAVVDICRRLDGIALAIEFAAARVPLLGVDGLRERLDERFRVLTGGSRLALRRHQTLRAALEWSHGLLTGEEQVVFRRLGAFVGTFGLESAQRVAAAAGIDEWAVIDRLGALVDKSLVVAEPGEPPRYRLLETSRAFALEMLERAGETDAVMRRHAEALLVVFEQSRSEEFVLPLQARLDCYQRDLDNVRAALDWTGATPDAVELHIALAGAVAWIWTEAALRPEGVRRTELALARIGLGTPPHLEAMLSRSWPALAFPKTGVQEMERGARAVAIHRASGDRRGLFAALCVLALTQTYRGLLDQAQHALDEADALIAADWPPAARVPLLKGRFMLLQRQGRSEAGVPFAEEILRIAIGMADHRLEAKALIWLEQGAAARGRFRESVADGVALDRRMREDRALARGLDCFVRPNLCLSLMQLGQVDEALEFARRAFPVVVQGGRTIDLLDPYALLAFKRGLVDDAARILGRAEEVYSADSFRREVVEQKLRDNLLSDLRIALPAISLARLMEEGKALADDEALRLALRDAGS